MMIAFVIAMPVHMAMSMTMNVIMIVTDTNQNTRAITTASNIILTIAIGVLWLLQFESLSTSLRLLSPLLLVLLSPLLYHDDDHYHYYITTATTLTTAIASVATSFLRHS